MEILPFLLMPFLASLILTGIHAYLGVHVVERGVIFVDLALAQIAALGATVAILMGMDPHGGGAYWVSLAFTFLGAAVFALLRVRRCTELGRRFGFARQQSAEFAFHAMLTDPDLFAAESQRVGDLLYIPAGDIAQVQNAIARLRRDGAQFCHRCAQRFAIGFLLKDLCRTRIGCDKL